MFDINATAYSIKFWFW